MGGIGFVDMWKSSPVLMSVLFGCSVILVATVLERLWCFGGPTKKDAEVCQEVLGAVSAGHLPAALQQATGSTSYIARALLEVVMQGQGGRWPTRQEFEDLWIMRKEEAAEAMRAKLVVFGTISFVTPLLGLMGSVLGIHHSFHSIALTGMGGPSVVAAGVSEALLCTLVGVSVAIPAMVFGNAFSSVLSRRMSHWDRTGQRMLQVIALIQRGAGETVKGGKGEK